MTKARERAIKMYWEMAKEKCPFQTEEIVNGYLEGFIDCAELFEEEDKLTLTKYARIIIDKKDECIEELEKENATLKKQLEALSGDIPWNELKDVSEVTKKLTEAKEIIRWFVVYEKGEGIITNYNNFLEQTEQFLKEVENAD